MRILAALLFLLFLLMMFATPAAAGVVWDEAVNGELSHSPATPTLLPFTVGGNIVTGTVINVVGRPRDYLSFIVPDGHTLVSMNLLVYTPDNIGFTAINQGVHSFFPAPETEFNYLSGIHLLASDVGSDLMELFVTRAVTTDSLGEPFLTPAQYCMVIQQTSVLVTTYSIEFVLSGPVATQSSTWGSIKALYR